MAIAALLSLTQQEKSHGGFDFRRSWFGTDRADGRLCHCAETGLSMFEAILGLVIAVALGIYLIITLIAPEKF